MSQAKPLAAPASDGTEVCVYVATPRAKRSFHTLLDAKDLFEASGRARVKTAVETEGSERRVRIETEHALRGGTIRETFELAANGSLASRRLERVLLDGSGVASRQEKIDFERGPLRLPEGTYPEVMLPFILRWNVFDGARRPLVAWIVDRFVARVYCESRGKRTISVPAGSFETIELMMYPDLNDWVSLGSVLTALAKPLLPKYHMWFEAAEPRRLVRFEGPYGPPGAPEIVLELS
jgi:hypothetical protein